MIAIFEASNPASPSCYGAEKTALLLLDYQNFIVDICGQAGKDAVTKAAELREWAKKRGILVLHSGVDIAADPAQTLNYERVKPYLDRVRENKAVAEEVAELTSNRAEHEYDVWKPIGIVSNLKGSGGAELLEERRIKSLIICGLTTSGCVLGTTIPSADHGFIVTVVKDACADPDGSLHQTLVEDVLPMTTHVVTAEELMREW